ncbi:unnamed protein product [Rotaria sp. Silwood1]|nr:unnamed protein product [Rotaria sp. Silwood1]
MFLSNSCCTVSSRRRCAFETRASRRVLYKRLSKTPAQILIRWSVQHGYITIPKTSKKSRLQSNADVFNWSIPDEDMKVLNALGDKPWSCTWDPTTNSLKEAGLQ